MRRLALLLAALLAPAIATAQAHPLVGVWTVTFAVGTRVENDVETPIIQTGTMTITAEGDSLVASTKMPPPEGMPERPPRRMAGRNAPGAVTFVLTSQAMINENGSSSMRTAVSTFTLSATGDDLSGTIVRKIEGADMGSTPVPVTGKRVGR